MFHLKSLNIKNFLSIQSASIDFSKPGLYIITGYNVRGGDSNGSGKSTILAAIAFALWGKTPGGLQGSDVANWDSAGDYLVELTLDGPEGNYIVKRGLDILTLFINDRMIKGHKRDVQELINETFHSSYDIFFSSTLFTSDMSDYLTKMGDADKKKLFKSILKLDVIDRAYAKAKMMYDENKVVADKKEQQVELLTNFLTVRKEELDRLKSQHENYENERQLKITATSQSSTTKPADYSDLVFELKSHGNALRLGQQRIPEMTEEADRLEEELLDAYTSVGMIKQSVFDKEAKIHEAIALEGTAACDKCGSPLGATYEQHLARLNRELTGLKNRELNEQIQLDELERSQMAIKGFFTNMETTQRIVTDLENRLEIADRDLKIWEENQKNIEDRIGELQKAANPYSELVVQCGSDMDNKYAQLKVVTDEYKEATGLMDILAFLKIVYSREGVSSQIIEVAFGRLQSLANRYLTKICSEGFLLNIVPQRELKTKALKEEIDIYVTSKQLPGRKIPYAALSGGQQQRINIALLMALYRFCRDLGCNDFDFIILDEVLDLSLAVKGQADVVSLLRDMLMEVGQIIVVSHKDTIAHDFDYEIQVRRDQDGRTKVV